MFLLSSVLASSILVGRFPPLARMAAQLTRGPLIARPVRPKLFLTPSVPLPFPLTSSRALSAVVVDVCSPPAVEVTQGDTLRIHAYNGLGDVGTSLHTHGNYFNGSAYFDGAVGVTQW